ncbi:MAG: hypothetical protein WDW38_006042 [Sanguina aurantia]
MSGERRNASAKSSKSAQAAKSSASVGFGGFSGASAVSSFTSDAPPLSSTQSLSAVKESGDEPGRQQQQQQQQFGAASSDSGGSLPTQLDGEAAQLLRHLSKRDSTTKLKALQAVRSLVKQRTPSELALLLPPYAYLFKRLSMDPNRSVRAEAAAALVAITAPLGKALAPHLKSLMGPWLMATFDAYGEAAATARAGLTALFPGPKQRGALLHCRAEVLAFLVEHLASTPLLLGDPRKDTPEEMEERHERVLSACCLALGSLMELLLPPAPPVRSASALNLDPAAAPPAPTAAAAAAPDGVEEVTAAVQAVIGRGGFFKAVVGSKSTMVRRSAYHLLRCASSHAPQLLGGAGAAPAPEAAAAVLATLQERDPGAHPEMWELLLTFVQAVPDCWQHANLRKAVLPRLYALLRHGCHGSGSASLPALLPLVSLLPRDCLGPRPDVVVQLLGCVWAGMSDPMGRSSRAASEEAYLELLAWALCRSATLSATAPASTVPAASLDTHHSRTPGSQPDQAAAAVAAEEAAAVAAEESAAVAAEAAAAAAGYCQLLLAGSLSAHALWATTGLGAAPPEARATAVAAAAVGSKCALDLVVETVHRISAAGTAASAATSATASISASAAQGMLYEMLASQVTGALDMALLSQPEPPLAGDSSLPSDNQASQAAGVRFAAEQLQSEQQRQQEQDAECLSSDAEVFVALEVFLTRLQQRSSSAAAVAACLAGVASGRLLTAMATGPLPPAASHLLSFLVCSFSASLAPGDSPCPPPAAPSPLPRAASGAGLDAEGAVEVARSGAGPGSLDPLTLLQPLLSGGLVGQAATARAGLLVSCLQSDPRGQAGAWDSIAQSITDAHNAAPVAQLGAVDPSVHQADRETVGERADMQPAERAMQNQRSEHEQQHDVPPSDALQCATLLLSVLLQRTGASQAAIENSSAFAALASVTHCMLQPMPFSRYGGAALWPTLRLFAQRGPEDSFSSLVSAAGDAVLGSCSAHAWIQSPAEISSAASPAKGDSQPGGGGPSRLREALHEMVVSLTQALHPGGPRPDGATMSGHHIFGAAAAAVLTLAVPLTDPTSLLWRCHPTAATQLVLLLQQLHCDASVTVNLQRDSQHAGEDGSESGDGREGGAGSDSDTDTEAGPGHGGGWRDWRRVALQQQQQQQQEQQQQEQQEGSTATGDAPHAALPISRSGSGDTFDATAFALSVLVSVKLPSERVLGAALRALRPEAYSRLLERLAAAAAASAAVSTAAALESEEPDLDLAQRLAVAWAQAGADLIAAASAVQKRMPAPMSLLHSGPKGLCQIMLRQLLAGAPIEAHPGSGTGPVTLDPTPPPGQLSAAVVPAYLAALCDMLGPEVFLASCAATSDPTSVTQAGSGPSGLAAAAAGLQIPKGCLLLATAAAMKQQDASSHCQPSTETESVNSAWHQALLCQASATVIAYLADANADASGGGGGVADQDPDVRGRALAQLTDLLASALVTASAAPTTPSLAGGQSRQTPPPSDHDGSGASSSIRSCVSAESALPALVSILSTLAAQAPTHPASLLALERFSARWLTPTSRAASLSGAATARCGPLPRSAMLHLLPILAPVLRNTSLDCLRTSGLASLSVSLMSELLSLTHPALRTSSACPSAAMDPEALEVLELLVLALPVQGPWDRVTRTVPSGSGRVGLADEEKPLLLNLLQRLHSQKQQRRRESQAGTGSGSTDIASSSSAALDPDQRTAVAVARLQLTAVAYHWRAISAPDWELILQEATTVTSAAYTHTLECVTELSRCACAAADRVLSSQDTAPATALALLLRLSSRNLLQPLKACYSPLLEGCRLALGRCSHSPTQGAHMQLAALLTCLDSQEGHKDGSSSRLGSRDGSDSGGTKDVGAGAAVAGAAGTAFNAAVAGYSRASMQLSAAAGAVEGYCAAVGDGGVALGRAWCRQGAGSESFWGAVACVAQEASRSRDSQAMTAALAASTAHLSAVGIDPISALLAVSLLPGRHPLQPTCYSLLLAPALLQALSLSPASLLPPPRQLPEFDPASTEPAAYLVDAGMRPELAAAIAGEGDSAAGHPHPRAYLPAWGLLLSHLLVLPSDAPTTRTLRAALREIPYLVPDLLNTLVALLPLQQAVAGSRGGGGGSSGGAARSASGGGGGGGGATSVAAVAAAAVTAALVGAGAQADGSWVLGPVLQRCRLAKVSTSSSVDDRAAVAAALYRAVLCVLPASARTWFSDLRDKGLAVSVEAYTAGGESPALLAAEMASIQAAGPSYTSDNFSVRAYPSTREVVATMTIEDGASLELLIKLPSSTPLRAAEVECRRKVGVSDSRLRKWLLSISAFLRNQNRGVADAVALWKRNLDKEFEGVEPCLICYTVIASTNASLPRLTCRTCAVKFHPGCLYKWFKSSAKSTCPHCQSPW